MRDEKSIKLSFYVAVALITAAAILVIMIVMFSGLEELSKPYILSGISSLLVASGANLGVVSSKKNSKRLRYIGITLVAIGLALLALCIAKLVGVL